MEHSCVPDSQCCCYGRVDRGTQFPTDKCFTHFCHHNIMVIQLEHESRDAESKNGVLLVLDSQWCDARVTVMINSSNQQHFRMIEVMKYFLLLFVVQANMQDSGIKKLFLQASTPQMSH